MTSIYLSMSVESKRLKHVSVYKIRNIICFSTMRKEVTKIVIFSILKVLASTNKKLYYNIQFSVLYYNIQFFVTNSNNSESFPLLLTQLLSGAPNNKNVVATDNKMVILNHEIYLNDVCLVRQKRK